MESNTRPLPVSTAAASTASWESATPPCPLCSGDARIRFTKFDRQYYKCGCGFVFIWPRPSEQELHDLYEAYGEGYWATEDMVRVAFSPMKSWREICFLRRFADAGTLLDVGCSTGSFVKAACEAGFEAEGVDICASSVQCGQRLGLHLSTLDILRDSLANSTTSSQCGPRWSTSPIQEGT